MRLQQIDLARLCRRFQHCLTPAGDLRGMDVLKKQPSPQAPSADEQQEYIDCAKTLALQESPRPWWLPYVCAFREQFVSVALCKCDDGIASRDAYLFQYAKQQPYVAMFQKLIRIDASIPDWEDAAVAAHALQFPSGLRFSCGGSIDFVHHEDVPFEEDDELIVYRCVLPQGVFYRTTRSSAPFDDFVAPMGDPNRRAPRQAPRASRARPSPDAVAALRAQFPFLTDEDINVAGTRTAPGTSGRHGASGSAGSGARSSGGGEDAPESVTDDEPDEGIDLSLVDEDLGELRVLWSDPFKYRGSFYVRVLGGKWTAEHVGQMADAAQGLARGGGPLKWCRQFKFPRWRRFGIQRFSMMSAHMLAGEFCRRGMFFYNMWLERGSPANMSYSADDAASYEETLEWVTWLTELDVESMEFEVGLEIRKLVPGR